jgi:hypothetical protein
MTFAPSALATLLLAASLALPTSASTPKSNTKAPRSVSDEVRRTQYMAAFEQHVLTSYAQARLSAYAVPVDVYREALLGYYSLRQSGQANTSRPVLTIIDYARPSSQKRMWVIDMKNKRVLYHTLVAHGRNTGGNVAETFSNREGSEMSSLGFYVTGQTYEGRHGLSLKLNGKDAGYNTNAATRAVVVHGADYVNEDFIRQHGRLGRSQGCPALPVSQSTPIIRVIQKGTVVYAHGPSKVRYRSTWLQLDPALSAFVRQQGLYGG